MQRQNLSAATSLVPTIAMSYPQQLKEIRTSKELSAATKVNQPTARRNKQQVKETSNSKES
jgi:hypothetical protein